MRTVMRTSFALAWLILFPTLAVAQAELTIFVSGAMTQPVRESGEAFTRSTGTKLVYVGEHDRRSRETAHRRRKG
jgi:ABC-type molybdate transport system substrate-binding protein